MSSNNTLYASAERSKTEDISRENKIVGSQSFIKDIFNGMPDVALVLNSNRQIVYANEGLLSILPEQDFTDILGKRPGEVIGCQNSKATESGCGTSESCRYCGAINAVLESYKVNDKVEKECRIVSFIEEEEVSFDFKVTAKPLSIDSDNFIMVYMQDISGEKRKMALERIFFHDILNTAGGIQGFTSFLQQVSEPDTMKEYVKVVDQLSHDLVDEIHAQRALVQAESQDLKVTNIELDALTIIGDVKNTVSYHVVAEDKEIVISNSKGSCLFTSDPILIKRILINMLRNALEASSDKGQVLIGYYTDNSYVTFYVHNDQFMSRDVQLQVFSRSFSTKGTDRGLGTYSIKLLSEKYLKGETWFETDEEKGTSFFVKVPL